jgi:Tripartite tricarboxylate transporter TctB family
VTPMAPPEQRGAPPWPAAMALAFLLLGAFLLYQALQLPMRSSGGPGPGLLPAALGVLIVALAARLIPATWRERVVFGDLRRIGIMTAALVLCTALLEPLGFVLATGLLMVILLVAFNERRRLAMAALGVIGVVVTYAVFYSVLKVQLPSDPWGLWR